MRIISKYKDFYDYLQYIYGQDDNVTWERDVVCEGRNLIGDSFYGRHLSYYNCEEFFSIISILGDAYVIADGFIPRPNGNFRDDGGNACKRVFGLLTRDAYEKILRFSVRKNEFALRNAEPERFESAQAELREKNRGMLVDLHRKYRVPILRVLDPFNGRWARVANAYEPLTAFPRLVAAIGDPAPLYQRIYNFFIEMNDNVDLRPPVELSEKDKIVEHGFDLKKSFRHPIK